jgi:hypothetical protein
MIADAAPAMATEESKSALNATWLSEKIMPL